ncbi:uncharacterized protein LOC120900048 isoform X2 [Anopheles arabiensis]|uniref:uncharacterized protein LOC120900048 isoform X2 n=1 Tax=Anopheles arabiensis TaxID=7173 RepID=UPI001AACE2ED|nr:uncharacterized protein LOC120900048 isoform X2 [Anopheles arabiensis]XP_040162494.1 uncharacterized protein LOC120900048 isoform X2 [Anopheles arabiensis]XP_040162495.1 uncharacterized protein LOC120900048 isoform X2 [Anopheles arabiensis]
MNRLDTILSDADLEISQLNECADRLAAVQSEYEKVHVSILEVSDTIEEEEEIYARFETKLYKLMRNAKQRIAAATVKEVLPSNVSKQTSRVKLPEIKFPKFDGSLQNWTTFRDNFKTLIDAAPELSEVDKFTYLISCLTEDAKRVIEVIEVTTANYSVAWDLLCTRYENKYLIVKSHVDSIFAISPIKKECPESIMRLVDEFERNLKMLEKLGERPEGWSTLLVFHLSSCLDPATLRQWETHKRSTEVPTYDELVKFLRDHCRVLQSVESVKLDPSDKTSSQFRRKPVQKNTAAYSTVSLGAAEKCVFCRDVKHSPYKCVIFRNMAVNDRKDLVKNKKLCFNCLSLGHTVKDCPSGTCRICHKKHHTMLHEQSNAMPVQEVLQQQTIPECQPGPSTPASSNPETPASLNHCFVNVPPASNQVSSTVLLQTAVVMVCDCNGTQYWARALLDSASQLNIVTERLVQRLRLPRIKEVHSIGGIGESKIMSYSSVMVSIKSNCSAFRTTSKFHVLSQVTRNLPLCCENYSWL